MSATIKVRIKRQETAARRVAASRGLADAGYRPRNERRNGHPVIVWVR